MIIARTVTVDRPPGVVFDYVSDFTTTTEWDPGTVHTVRIDGDGGVGTTYRNTSRFLGRTTELIYVVIERLPATHQPARGEHDGGRHGHDDPPAARPGTTELTYRAEFTFKGRGACWLR